MRQQRQISEAQLECEYDKLMQGLSAEASEGNSGEPVDDAYGQMLPEFLAKNPVAKNVVVDWLQHEPITNLSYRKRVIRSAGRAVMIHETIRYGEDFPSGFDDPDKWNTFANENWTSSDNHQFERWATHMNLPYNKNLHRRDVAAAAVAAAMQTRDGFSQKRPTVFRDWGAAAGLTLKALELRRFSKVPVVGENEELDKTATALFDFLLHTARYGEGIGIDRLVPKTTEELFHIKACTLSPSKLGTDSKPSAEEEEFDLLSMAQPQRTKLVKGDMLMLPNGLRKRLHTQKGDIAMLNFVLGQNPGQTYELVKAILPTIAEGGKLLITDYVEVDAQDPQKIHLRNRWEGDGWLCRTVSLDADHPEAGFKTLFEYPDGNLDILRFGKDIGSLGYPFKESGLVRQ